MKLKKQVKVVIVLILLGGIGFGFYSFNQWFFAKYKTKDVNVEEKNEGTSKEILEAEQSNSEEVPIVKEEPSSSTKTVKKIRPTETYYCSEGDTLEGKECITKIETNATPVVLTMGDNTYTMKFDFTALAYGFSVEEEDIIPIVEETCKTELKGRFYIDLNDEHGGYCTFSEEQKPSHYICSDSSYTLKGDKCVKEVKIPAKIRYECSNGYILDGIYCQKK